jgi:LL-diaminopimelate aminotransferase
MFGAVQRASVAALSGPQDCVREMCGIYQRRRDLLVAALRRIGMHVDPPKGTIYLWAPVPDGYTSAGFTEQVLDQAAVVVTPGAAYGAGGEGYVRLSLTVPDERLREAVRRIEERVRL